MQGRFSSLLKKWQCKIQAVDLGLVGAGCMMQSLMAAVETRHRYCGETSTAADRLILNPVSSIVRYTSVEQTAKLMISCQFG